MVREQDLFRVSMRNWYKNVMHYPCPPNLNIWWNFGSMLLACVIIQIVTGLLLSVHYTADDNLAFRSIKHIMRDVNNGWAIRNIHAGGASVFFFFLYIHIARGIYYGTFLNSWATWNVGVLLYFLSMATAFSGYVLPWGTMSYWAATVIINMLGCLPFGKRVVLWALGGNMVNNNTLKRIYTLHFILPFVILFVSGVHIWFLHNVGSSNPLGIDLDGYLVRFHPYYTTNDLVGLVFLGAMYWFMAFVRPDLSYEPLNYVKIDKFKTPNHIQPEWYFLYAYAILKCIPYKTLGVTAMLMSSMCMVLLPLIPPKYRCQSMCMYPLTGFVFWWWVSNFCFLTAVGTCRPEGLAYEYGQRAIYYHFAFFLVVPFLNNMWDTLITNDYYFAPWGCWQFNKWIIYLEQELIDDAKKIAGNTSNCEVFDVNDMLDMELVELNADANAFVASCGTYRMSIVEFWRNLKGWIFDILYRILQWVDEWSAGCNERRMAFFLFLSSLSMLDFMWGTAFGVWLVAWVNMGIFWSNVLTFSVLLSCVYAYKKTRESYLEANKEIELDNLSNNIKEMEAKMEEVENKFNEAKKKL